MMFYSSFEDVGKKVASKTQAKILSIDEKLFTDSDKRKYLEERQNLTETPRESADMECSPDNFFNGRYIEKQFDEDLELYQWCQAFPYLRLTGNAIKHYELGSLENEMPIAANNKQIDENSHYFEDDMLVDTSPVNKSVELSITGKCLPMSPLTKANDEEIFACDGVVEEILALDFQGNDDSDKGLENGISPQAADKLEALLVGRDLIWPTVVTALRPLIEAVILTSEKHNICFENSDETAPVESDFQDGFFCSDEMDENENDLSGW